MSWFTNLFSSSNNSRSSGRTAISSTHEAFSLPTSSPTRHPQDGFPGSPSMTDFPQSGSSAYSYPPQSPTGSYDYVPTTANPSRKSTLLPLHGQSGSMNAPFPPLSQTWNRLRAWLTNEYPELGDTLNYGILPQDLAQIEMSFGFALPQSVRDSYLCTDGQEAESAAGCSEGLFFGLSFLPLEEVLDEWRFWREVDDDPNTGANPRLRDLMDSLPPTWVRKEYSCRGWIPLIADKAGNYLGVDLHPGEGGSVGQVIVFGRDFDTKVVMWRGDGTHGWAKWLSGFVDDLEAGEGYELGANNDGSDGSEDSVGYESYFFDGVGRGLGDGGGDTGTGGLRLAGEYKGWNVLEAWADRSVRKWQEVGIISAAEEPSTPVKNQVRESAGNDILREISGSSAAEVPIPVLTDDTDAALASNAAERDSLSTARQSLPTISVTKPPMPMAIDLPTPDDIVPLSDSAYRQTDDLESGGSTMMREVANALPAIRTNGPTSLSSPTSPSPRSRSKPSPIQPPPQSPSRTPTATSYTGSEYPLSPISPPPTTDLLADTSITLSSTPLETTAPPAESSSSSTSSDSPVLINSEDALPPSVSTIRLVGSGGSSGTAVEKPLTNDDVANSGRETEAIGSSPSPPPAADPPVKRGRHESKKSSLSAGLKKLGTFGAGKRRTDSVSSAKQVL